MMFFIYPRKSIEKEVAFYFVYCYETTGEVTASAFSCTVDNYGGAGYILEYGGTYYVTAACYYSYDDALSVCENLNFRGINCGILSAQRSGYPLTTKNDQANIK
ncbi:MAG: hypothetical protein LUI60_00040, partial [Clostridia bacterium]|nr:hypothetical protein [Clostridia bacterium]